MGFLAVCLLRISDETPLRTEPRFPNFKRLKPCATFFAARISVGPSSPSRGTRRRRKRGLRSPKVISASEIGCAFYLFIRQPMGRKSALRREIPWILRGFQGRLSC